MATPAEEAVLRAKAIAARLSAEPSGSEPPATSLITSAATEREKIQPTEVTRSINVSGGKRKRWGVVPMPIASAAKEMLPGLADATKRLKQNAEPVTRRIWVPTSSERSELHYLSYLSPRLQDLLGELVGKVSPPAEDGLSREMSLELKGRGSSRDPPPPGMPEEPMHVLISGGPELVNMAEGLVDSLLADADRAPIEISGSTFADYENPSCTDHDVGGMPLALSTLPKPSTGGYRPATVAQLIANAPAGLSGAGPEVLEEKVGVPNGVVGYLIGRGGETISSMQSRSGCKIQIQKEHELQPGQTLRVISLSASTKESIEQCRGMIESMVQDRIRAAGGVTASSNVTGVSSVQHVGSASKEVKVNEALASGHVLLQVQVPDADVGLIIGKSGMTIKSIQDTTGASIQIPPSGNVDDPSVRTVSITHPQDQGAQLAKRQIEGLLKSKPSYASNQVAQVTIQVLIPDKDVGLCIGRQGCVIREMQHKTKTRIQIPSQPSPSHSHRTATVIGSQDGCDQVQAMIDRIINEQSSACVMSGTPYHNQLGEAQYGTSPQTQPHQHYGKPEAENKFSAEWQAYYAAQALAKQQRGSQEMISGNSVVAAATPPVVNPSPDAYHEQFFRYSYYYGEDAARKYYGEWSPPIGTTNPYGANPSGIISDPIDVAVAAARSDHTGQRQTRDSSVRKVSNLPAWMTRET